MGSLLTGSLLPRDAPAGVLAWIALAGMLALLAAGFVTISSENSESMNLNKWRAGLLLAGLVGAAVLLVCPASVGMGGMLLVFCIAMAEEAIGRWLFYTRRNLGI